MVGALKASLAIVARRWGLQTLTLFKWKNGIHDSVVYNRTDRNSYFAGTGQRNGLARRNIVHSFLRYV